MSSTGIASTLFSLFPTSKTDNVTQSGLTGSVLAGTSDSTDFSSSLAVRMATLQAQSLNLLMGSENNRNNTTSSLDFLLGTNNASSSSTDSLSLLGLTTTTTQSLSASGRNLSLFDPESAYNMMSIINKDDVVYKAQFSELSEMKTAVAGMQQAGLSLGSIDGSQDNAAITSQLQDFVGKYNDWIKRFDDTVKSGGVLDGTQAAEVSLYELEQSVENPFNGASDGFHGLSDLGISIDESTNLASLDTNKLNAALTANKSGAIDTIGEFSANFAKSAELLNSDGNFIPNRLANLDRVIDYISDNKSALQTEFGLGAPAKLSEQIAKALASYEQMASV